MPLRPAAYNYYRGAQGHKMGIQTNHAFKMVNMLIGEIDTPGGHMGVTLDDKWDDFNHIVPGENGRSEAHSAPTRDLCRPSRTRPTTLTCCSYFPVGVHPPHLNLEVFLNNPGKYGIDFDPDVMLICHSNPLWAMQGPRDEVVRVHEVDAIHRRYRHHPDGDHRLWADVILPTHDALESWNMTMIEPPHTEGMCLRQPATEPLYDTKSEEDIFTSSPSASACSGSTTTVVNMSAASTTSPN